MASPWYLQPGILPDVLPDQTGNPYQLARSSVMTSGNYPGMQTRFGHTTGNWDDIDARQRLDAARAYQQNQPQQQQQPKEPSIDELLARQYRPTVGSTPGIAQIGDELIIGGKTVTPHLAQDAAAHGMDPDAYAQSLYGDARSRAANSFRDYLSGNTQAGTGGRQLIDDPRFQGLAPQKQASVYQQAYGHGLEEDLQADLLAKSYGKPMTYTDINSLQMRQKNQAKDLAYLGAMSSMMGTRGELFEIANNPYDPKEGGVHYKAGQYDEPQIAHMTPEQHAILKQKFNQTLFPQALMPGQPQAAPTAQAVQQNPQHAPLTPEEQARLAAYHKRMLSEYRGKPMDLPPLTQGDRQRFTDFLLR
jgi:hypothetical protein